MNAGYVIWHAGLEVLMNTRRQVGIMVILLASMAYFCCEDSKEGVSDPPRNHAPMIDEQSDTLVTVGDTLNLTASASDQDGDSVS